MKNLFLFLVLLSFPAILLGASPKYQSYYANIESVTDGDTIKVIHGTGSETIRILWLDTPEIFTTRFWYSECYGKEASEYAKKYLTWWTQVYIESYWKDKYDRLLADVYIWTRTGTLLAKDMIQNGYWWTYKKGIKTWNYLWLLRSENLAKRMKKGLWSSNSCNGERRFIPENKTIIDTNTVTKNEIYSCKTVPRYCSGVKSRSEAQFYLHSCGATRFDMDYDDIACEEIQ